eukprot:TRINITY_DN13692_c0_g1_i1.p1 TRINITY_DN13692_c0_g1~~TRINITY_DN13692_c0_g1_i1.p1  ORF type:complete len:161 (-),score=44.19 TRINITY_DN13692_c0_g1_i1:60-542(-)
MPNRVVFISASFLVNFYNQVPEEIMDNAIFFFGSNRKWVFPETDEEIEDSKQQPTDYLNFPEDFKELILRKEEEGLMIWLKPEKDYNLVSEKIQQIIDPTTNENYKPLILDDDYWKESKKSYYISPKLVPRNYNRGLHSYSETMELLKHSNPTMKPVLTI